MIFDIPPDPPKLWLPPKPAIIRPAPDLVRRPLLAHRLRRAAGNTGVTAASVNFLHFQGNASNLTTYTFSGVAIGSGSHVVVVAANNDGTPRTISSMTVDGASASAVVSRTNSFSHMAMRIAARGSNTTGDIVVTYTAGTGICQIAVFEVDGINSATAEATDNDVTDATAVTGAVSAGGIAIAAAVTHASTTFSWTGDGADHGDNVTESRTLSAASAAYAGAGTASMTPDAASASQFISLLATFR